MVDTNAAVGRTRASAAGSWATLTEHITAPSYPGNTISYYETSLIPNDYYNQGCAAARRKQAGIVVLDFGQPTNWSATSIPQFGTRLVGSQLHAYISNGTSTDIRHLVDQFAKGYDAAYTGANPTKCTLVAGPRQGIEVVIATSNDTSGNNNALTSDHAVAWAAMIDGVRADTFGIQGILAQAGIDAEPNYDLGYTSTANWVNSYSQNGHTLCYNFGSTDGYPNLAQGEPTPVVPNPYGYSAWRVDQLYDIATGIMGQRPLPQIYRPKMARDWYRVQSWSQTRPGPSYAMTFAGIMSECRSSGCQPPADFRQEQAWQVFWLEFNADPNTQQAAPNSTDIQCSNGGGVGCAPNSDITP